ncbi:MAG TPA: hypothetical protein HPP56_01425 [Nitrospirae bacterium]|nr:hypothetical protein [Nitrospirota bacterium]
MNNKKYLLIAVKALEQGELFIAEKILAQLYKRQPEDNSILYLYIDTLINIKDLNKLLDLFDITSKKETIYNILKEYGIRFCSENVFESIVILSKLHEYCPDDKEVMCYLGFSYYNMKIFEIADTILKTYVDSGGTKKEAFLYLADIAHSVKRDSKLAYFYFSKSLGISDEKDKHVYHMLALQSFALGRFNEAIEFFHRASDYKNNHIEGYFTEGLSQLFINDYKSAEASIKEVISRFGDYNPAQFILNNLQNPQNFLSYFFQTNLSSPKTKSLCTTLRPFAKEIESQIICHRDKIWHSANFYNDLDGLILYAMIRIIKPKNVIEFSPYRGYSTLFIYKALEKNNEFFSFETFDLAECTEFTEMMRLFNINLKVRTGDAIQTVPLYIKENNLDRNINFCHIDSLHEYEFAQDYINKIFPLLGDDCIIAIHDIYYMPDNLEIPFDHYGAINSKNICENPASIGEAKAVRDFFKDRDDYILFSTNKLFGGLGHGAPPLPLNSELLSLIGSKPTFLENNFYWTQSPMLLIAIPKRVYSFLKKEFICLI